MNGIMSLCIPKRAHAECENRWLSPSNCATAWGFPQAPTNVPKYMPHLCNLRSLVKKEMLRQSRRSCEFQGVSVTIVQWWVSEPSWPLEVVVFAGKLPGCFCPFFSQNFQVIQISIFLRAMPIHKILPIRKIRWAAFPPRQPWNWWVSGAQKCCQMLLALSFRRPQKNMENWRITKHPHFLKNKFMFGMDLCKNDAKQLHDFWLHMTHMTIKQRNVAISCSRPFLLSRTFSGPMCSTQLWGFQRPRAATETGGALTSAQGLL